MDVVKAFDKFSLIPSARFDRNKIYYGFIHNFSSENTREAYRVDLIHFFLFLSDKFQRINELQAEQAHIVAYKNFLMEKELSQRTINRKLSCLWSFYEHLIDLKLIEKNPVERVKRFKVRREIKTLDLTDEQVVELLKIIPRHSPAGKLHLALLTLYFTTGMRQSEVAGLKFKNLEELKGLTVIRYIAKGGAEMVTPLHPRAEAALGAYLRWCETQGLGMEKDQYLFRPTVNPVGSVEKRLDSKSLNYMIKKYAKKIGIKEKITIHSARATVIGMLLDQGHSIDKVADFVGHRDMGMTKAYSKRKTKLKDALSLKISFDQSDSISDR